jgi:hypothetical protein
LPTHVEETVNIISSVEEVTPEIQNNDQDFDSEDGE